MAGFLGSMFSPSKVDKPPDEVITIILPLKWNNRGLESAEGLVFGIPDIPDNTED